MFLHADELVFPLLHLLLEGLDVRRAVHGLRLQDVVVQHHLAAREHQDEEEEVQVLPEYHPPH